MANRDELIQQFSGMTGASADQAKFFLEMAGWELKVAVDQFYELGEGIGAGSSQGQPKTEQTLGGSSHPVAPVRPQTLGGSSSSSAAGSNSSKSRSTRPNSGNSKFRTLNDLNRADSADDSDDEHQNLYAGGEKSGMVVQGPNKHSDLINQILKKAAQGGPAPEEEDGPSVRKPKYFKGSGYKLGSEEEPSQLVNPTVQSDSEDELLEPVTRYLTFWRNGFSVDDGPLYIYDDPANQTMLNAINSGRAPLSLLNVRHGQPVDVRVARRQDEDYVPPPKAPPKQFEGTGHRLGSPAAYSPGPSTPGAFPSSSSSAPQTPASTPQVTLDESQPTTSVQIRLADGTKLVSKFNHTHTVGDIRRYIDASRPTNRAYILQTTFPVKQLTDDNCTLKDAGLLNSVVVQRYQ